MSERDEEIRRIVAELDLHLAQAEAGVAALKALMAEDNGEGAGEGETSVDPAPG